MSQPLCPAAVTARANSDLCMIEHMIERRDESTPERMARIISIVDSYKRATEHSTERARHRRHEAAVNPYAD